MFRASVRLWSQRQVTASDVQAALRVLGLQPGATPDEVRKRYLKAARENHPDVNGNDDSKMKLVNLAYETVQQNGHLLNAAEPRRKTGEGPDATKAEVNQFKKKWKRGPTSAVHHEVWNTKSEFDWAAAVGVTPDERLDGRNHPNSYNPLFSFDDDATLYQQIRSGASVTEAARTLGKTDLAVERRLNSAQFKLRVQRLLKRNGTGAKSAHRNLTNNDAKSSGGNTQTPNSDEPTPVFKRFAAPSSRTYAHLRRFAKQPGR